MMRAGGPRSHTVRNPPNDLPWPAAPCSLASRHDPDQAKRLSRLVGGHRRLPVHADGLCRRLLLRRLLRRAGKRVRRAPRRDRPGLLDLGLPLFPAGLPRRPHRRPHWPQARRGRRPAADRRRPGRRRASDEPVADLCRLRAGRRRGHRPLLRAERRRRAALVRAPPRHGKRHRRRGHRRRHADRRAAGAPVDRPSRLAPDLSRARRPHRRSALPSPARWCGRRPSATASRPTATRRIPRARAPCRPA